MIKEFVLYKQALALKELGFNEPCFGTWRKNACKGNPFEYNIDFHTKVELDHDMCPKNSDYVNDWISAMTYSQAFRWFRGKYNLDSEIYMNHEYGSKFYTYLVLQLDRSIISHLSGYTERYTEYEKAELDCLRKLIEIVKNK